MFHKLLTGGVALALAAVMIGLVGVATTGTAQATLDGISSDESTVNAAGTANITIDADVGDSVQIVATTGTITVGITSCNAGTCTIVGTNPGPNVTVTGLVGTTETVTVLWTAPATGPASATISAIVGTGAKSVTIKVRGTPDTTEISILTAVSTSTTSCQGTTAHVIQSSTATQGNTTGFICVVVKDSDGTRTALTTVILTKDVGTLSAAADATGATGQVANLRNIIAGSTGTSGKIGTVTASAGGKSATAEIKFGGNADHCTITTNPTSVSVGGSSVVSTDFRDDTDGPIPDAVVVAVVQTNAGSGANAAILNAVPTTSNGIAATSLIAAIPGAIALGSSAGPAGAVQSCTGTVLASDTVIPPTGGGTGVSGFTGTAPAAGSIGLLVTSDASDAAGLIAALGAAGCTVESLAVLEAGVWKVNINGAPAVVNANFPASLAATTPFFTRCA